MKNIKFNPRYLFAFLVPLLFCACNSLIGIPVIGPLSMEIAGSINARRQFTEREDTLRKKIEALNDERRQYEEKAQEGDVTSQVMVARTLRRQIVVYKAEERSTRPLALQTETQENIRTLSDEYRRYLQLALDQNDPSAQMYDLCIRALDGDDSRPSAQRWQPDQHDIAVLEKLAEMEKAHAKYLLASHVYSGTTASKPDAAKAERFLLDAFHAGDKAATRKMLLLRHTSQGRSSPEMIMAVATAEKRIRGGQPGVECPN